MNTPTSETFSIVAHIRSTALVPQVVPATGTPSHHSCPLEAFEGVAHAVEGAGESGFDVFGLAEQLELPFSQVATAIEFLRERGIIEWFDRGHTKAVLRRDRRGPSRHHDRVPRPAGEARRGAPCGVTGHQRPTANDPAWAGFSRRA